MMKFLTNKTVQFILLFLLFSACIVYSNSKERWRQEIQNYVFDTLNQTFERQASDQIIIVDIDDDSLLELGQWPWPRNILADIVTNLESYGAKVIAFDGVLAEPDRSSPHLISQRLEELGAYEDVLSTINELPNNDEILAKAIERSKIFVSAFTYGFYSNTPRDPLLIREIQAHQHVKDVFYKRAHRFKKTANFLPLLEKASAGNGSFMAKTDEDGIIRKTSLVFSNENKLYPSLSMEALRVALENKKVAIRIGETKESERELIDTDYRLILENYVIPINQDGVFFLYYRSFDKDKDYISAHKILSLEHEKEARERIKDKIVFIASSSEGLKDLRNTAITPFVPGVEIHANAAEQILQGKYLKRNFFSAVAEAIYILIAGGLMIILAPFIHVFFLGAICLATIGLAFTCSLVGYVDHGLLLDPFYPSICTFAIFLVSTLLTYMRVEYDRKHVKDAFGHYISPAFMKELTKNPDKLKLGGEIKDLTIMFTDIRRFTSISEGLSPEELIQLMNDFLTPMSDLVMTNRGTIDKYMGDAMMAFWNAPLDDKDHAKNACRAALKMQEALEPINAQVKTQAQEKGKDPVLLQAGIGINTGPCAVGNMGSKQRFAYSTLGDAVNLASRLEGQTKMYGVGILVGEETVLQAKEFGFFELDLLQVKGKTKPVRVFALLGDEEYAKKPEIQAWHKTHNDMLAAYRSQEFEKAKELIKACQKQAGNYLEVSYQMYQERIKELDNTPPGQDWDGVYVATSK